MRGMPVGRATACAFAVAAASAGAWIGCDLGLDVDALGRGCPECRDAAISDVTDAGEDTAARDADADVARCPSARGSEMVLAATSCIDRTEVTNDHYAAFLASGARLDTAPCEGAGSYVPPSAWPPSAAEGGHPVTHVTWCAARAFCSWAGKRLCGRRNPIGTGGALDVALLGRPDFDEWTAACSSDGTFAYPYGNTYSGQSCNGDDYAVRDTIPAGDLASCAVDGGPRDLSGNVWEWIDACEIGTGFCYAHGGAFNSPASELACTSRLRVARDASLDTTGFRCCAP